MTATLGFVIEDTERLTGCAIERAYVDKGYRGHDTENPRRVFISGQKRGVFGLIKRELRRRPAIEAVIGHHVERPSRPATAAVPRLRKDRPNHSRPCSCWRDDCQHVHGYATKKRTC